MRRWLNRACWVLLWAAVLALAYMVLRIDLQLSRVERKVDRFRRPVIHKENGTDER